MGLSPKYLNELSKDILGRSALRVIQHIVIEEAKALLFQSNANIAEISYTLGFEEPTNFSRLFKHLTKQTPLQYRASVRN